MEENCQNANETSVTELINKILFINGI